jgi:hypothetical protein
MNIISSFCDGIVRLIQSRRLASVALVGIASLLVLYTLFNVALRIAAPFQFDVFEGRVLTQAVEISHGKAMYRDPSRYPAADLYTPGYALLLGQLHRVLAPSFLWGRLLSALASAATCALLIACFMQRDRISLLVAIVVAALLAGMAWRTQWFLVALKPDALCHLIWIAGLACLMGRRAWHVVLSATLVALAFYVKQTALFAVPGALLFLFFERRRDAALFLVSYMVGMALFMLLFLRLAGAWMPNYIFNRMEMQARFPIVMLLRHFFSLTAMPLMLTGAVVALCSFPDLQRYRAYRLAIAAVPFLIAGSVLTAASPGGATNSLLPACYGLAFLAGFGVLHLLRKTASAPGALWGLALLLAFQCDAELPYNVGKSLGRFDHEFVEVVELLKQEGGSMYAPSHNVLTLLAGQHLFDDRCLAFYIKAWAPEADRRITENVNSGRFDWLVMAKWEHDLRILSAEMRDRYEVARDGENWTVLRKKRSVGGL